MDIIGGFAFKILKKNKTFQKYIFFGMPYMYVIYFSYILKFNILLNKSKLLCYSSFKTSETFELR